MQELITKLRENLYSKPAPGLILNNLFEKKLKELESEFKGEIDHEALWIGSYIADLFITEAKDKGDITEHVPMAIKFAKEIIKEYKINTTQADKIIEIISTHHGGEQKYLESKLFKNSDCFKFLLPEGVFHIFSANYKNNPENLDEAMNFALFKIDEKHKLVDLNDKLIKEAEKLYNDWIELFSTTKYKVERPKIYGSKK